MSDIPSLYSPVSRSPTLAPAELERLTLVPPIHFNTTNLPLGIEMNRPELICASPGVPGRTWRSIHLLAADRRRCDTCQTCDSRTNSRT